MPNTWADREKAYNELMRIMGQKVQRQIPRASWGVVSDVNRDDSAATCCTIIREIAIRAV